MHPPHVLTMAISLGTVISTAVPGVAAPAAEREPTFHQRNLVSNLPGVADFTDPNLRNPWGISASATSPMWVSDNGTGVTTLYRGDGSKVALTVTIPPGAGSAPGSLGAPTGTVFNGNGAEVRGDRFLFATEDGTIAGWKGGLSATTEGDPSAPRPGAVYQGWAKSFDG